MRLVFSFLPDELARMADTGPTNEWRAAVFVWQGQPLTPPPHDGASLAVRGVRERSTSRRRVGDLALVFDATREAVILGQGSV